MKKLCKSRRDRKICGVCGGMAEYFGIDPTIVRVLWVIFGLFAFTGVIVYLVCAMIIPDQG